MRIALVAMSGIRVCDQELLQLGLTLPGFVERSKVIASLPSLGLLTLAALTPSRHEVRYLEIPDLSALPDLPRGFDLVAISSYSAQIHEAYDLAQRYRDSGTKVVLGGPHVTALPEEALGFCDAVVLGEGEPVWEEVLADCEAGRLQGIYDARSAGYDLARSPIPAFELLEVDRYNRLTVQTSRGCPHQCEFCASSLLLTERYKQKPIANVLREIDRILEIWEHPFLEFADDNSFVDKSYWKELLPALRDRGVRWFTETDISVADDEDLLNLMRESGCAQVLIGLESPTVRGLHGIELKSDWKLLRFEGCADAVRRIQAHGITVNGCFVVGLDGHTPEIFDQILEFSRLIELYDVQVTIQTAFPGTPLYARLLRDGRLLEPTNWRRCTLFDVNYRPTDMSPDELAAGFRRMVVPLYSAELTDWRRSLFKSRMRKLHPEKGMAS
jgi:radical SAM superfamily enzyme YgiQ (UPF0313 family)